MGFFVGVFLDGTGVSFVGVTFGVLSSMITAIHSVVIKRSLDVVKGSALHLSWYTNLYSAIALAPVIVIAGEVPAIVALLAEPDPMSTGISPLNTFLWGSAITVCPSYRLPINHRLTMIQGVFGFLMSIASLLSIKVTSPITHMVSSAVRGVAASVLGVWLFNDVVTTWVHHLSLPSF